MLSLSRSSPHFVLARHGTVSLDTRIASLADQGIDHVIVGFPAGITPDRQDTVSRQLIAAVTGRLP
jgi:hypothetical protein